MTVRGTYGPTKLAKLQQILDEFCAANEVADAERETLGACLVRLADGDANSLKDLKIGLERTHEDLKAASRS